MADLSYQSLINSLMAAQPSDPRLYKTLLESYSSSDSRRPDIEDRRSQPDMTPEWKNVPGSLSAIATSLGNTLWGTPRLPEAPSSSLGEALGLSDVKLERAVGSRSPLDRAIDDVTDTISIFRKPGEKLGSDVPFTQRSFSKGYF